MYVSMYVGFILIRNVIGPQKSRHFPQSIRFKTRTNRDFITHVLLSYEQFTCFYFNNICLRAD